jgi:hypothetical protein
MKIIYNKWLPPKRFDAINLFGYIFARHGATLSERTIRHESIHSRQMREMLYLFFHLWYGVEWLIRLLQYRNAMTAYYNILFEREAYANDKSEDYLNTRKWWAWVRYLKKV